MAFDAAVQPWTVGGAGFEASRVSLVHLNKGYERPGGEHDLEQLFVEEHVTAAAEAIQGAVAADVSRLLRALASDIVPRVPEGTSCSKPYDCPYCALCPALDDPTEHPVSELPGNSRVVEARALDARYESVAELGRNTHKSWSYYASRLSRVRRGHDRRAPGSAPRRRARGSPQP
ncbi:MAG: hypothetical protein WCP98_14165 [Actinomycetes bacterium]